MIKVGLFLFFIAASSSSFSKDPPLEGFISKEEILKNIGEYRKEMPKKGGYKGSKSWSVLVEHAAIQKDERLLQSILSIRPSTPQKNSEYRHDVFPALKLNPDFFLSVFDKYFDGEVQCLNWFFDRDAFSLKDLDFKSIPNERVQKLSQSQKLSEAMTKKCLKTRNQKIRQYSHNPKS